GPSPKCARIELAHSAGGGTGDERGQARRIFVQIEIEAPEEAQVATHLFGRLRVQSGDVPIQVPLEVRDPQLRRCAAQLADRLTVIAQERPTFGKSLAEADVSLRGKALVLLVELRVA